MFPRRAGYWGLTAQTDNDSQNNGGYAMKKSHVLRQLGLGSQAGIWVVTLMLMCLLTPLSAISTDKLIVKNGDGETTLKIEDNGCISSAVNQYEIFF